MLHRVGLPQKQPQKVPPPVLVRQLSAGRISKKRSSKVAKPIAAHIAGGMEGRTLWQPGEIDPTLA
jgi:hypothetical protein